MTGLYVSKLLALLGDIACHGRTGRLSLNKALPEEAGTLRFMGGLLAGFRPPSSDTNPAESAVDPVTALRRKMAGAILQAAASPGALPAFGSTPAAEPPPAGAHALNAADLVLDLCRHIEDRDLLDRHIKDLRSERLVIAGRRPMVEPHVALGPVEGFLLSRVDGTLTCQELLDTSPLGEKETIRALVALRVIGLITTQSTPGAGTARATATASAAPAPPRAAGASGTPRNPAPVPATAKTARLSSLDRFLQKTSAPAENPSLHRVPQPPAAPADNPALRNVPQHPAAPADNPALRSMPQHPAAPADNPSLRSMPQHPAAPSPDEQKEREELLARCHSLEGLDHYAVLGVERSADEATIRRAYYQLARRYHPDRLLKPHLDDLLRQLEKMFAVFTEAYNTLTEATARAEYDRSLATRGVGGRRESGSDRNAAGRDAYLRGRKEMEAGKLFEALRLFESAIERDPSRSEYFHHLGVCQGQNPRWRKKAEENLMKAIQLNPGAVQSYLALARIYRKGGLERRSNEMYENALKWDPTCQEALVALGRAEADPQDTLSTGMLRSLFKKD